MTSLVGWVNSVLLSPAESINASGNRRPGDACFSAPLHYGHGNAVNRNAASIRSVILLLCHCSPAAIFRLIVLRIVHAINRQAIRALTHVRQKVLKLPPSFADSARCIVTAEGKPAPNAISARLGSSRGLPMGGARSIRSGDFLAVVAEFLETCRVRLLHQTATRTCVAENQTVGWRDK